MLNILLNSKTRGAPYFVKARIIPKNIFGQNDSTDPLGAQGLYISTFLVVTPGN